jgi:hypothetical protein
MKYLSNRDEFIKRSIDKINEYKSYDALEPLNEAIESGPFANDIPWGNSLVGRLVNRLMRNAKKGANLVRIKSVINKLKDAMDDILDGPAKEALSSNENEKELHRLIVFSFIDNLEKSVKEGEELQIIINLTKNAIDDIKKYDDIDNKDSLISQLEEFLKFLEGLKENKDEKPKEEKDEDSGVRELFYDNSVKLIKSTLLICDVIKNEKIKYNKSLVGNKKKQTTPQTTQQQKTTQPTKVENSVMAERFFYENESLPIFESELGANETKVIYAWSKVENAYKNSGIANMVARMQELIKNSESGENAELYKKTISKIGYQVVMNEQTIGKNMLSLDALVKEELNPDSENDIPKAISLLGNVVLAFKDDLGLASQLIEANQPIKDFITSYDKLKELLPKLKTYQDKAKEVKEGENKEEVKKESRLLRYSNFISINEADEETKDEADEETKDEEVSAPTVMTTTQKIQDYWDKKIDVKAFTLEKTEVIKMKQKFDKISKEEENKEKFWIYDIDPIIEIVKCFNRAYKLHTTPVIPNVGTTDGRVSASTFAQYTPFGGGNKMNAGLSGGPYRNNAIFDQWENAVMDIIKGTKYQKIFRKEVVIKTKDGNEIKNAGQNLRKFMTDMLDGDSLYKSGGQGRQAKFLDEYFGWKGDQTQLEIKGSGDGKNNEKNADGIKTKKMRFINTPLKIEKNEDLKETFFAANTNDRKQLYFYIQDVKGTDLYISYCSSMYFFKKYIEESEKIGTELDKGKLDFGVNTGKDKQGGEEYKIYGFKVPVDKVIDKDGNFRLNGEHVAKTILKYQEGKNKSGSTSLTEQEINFKSLCSLGEVSKDEDDKETIKRFALKNTPTASISKNGGFVNISVENDINKTSLTKK